MTARSKLEDRFEKLGNIVFHEELGTVKDKAERVMALAKELAPKVGADPAQAERAAKLAKCDLVSDMVGEFAELEGVMGRYYATSAERAAGNRGCCARSLQAERAGRRCAERSQLRSLWRWPTSSIRCGVLGDR